MSNTTLPSQLSALQAEYDALVKSHSLFLEKYGVKLPGPNNQLALALIFLNRQPGQLVSLEAIRAFIRNYWAGKSEDKQPRHLKYDGWHILLSGKSNDILPHAVTFTDTKGRNVSRKMGEKVPNGYLMLVTDKQPSPDFQKAKRRGSIDRSSWDAVCRSYDYKCAVCKQKALTLEKGHKDPAKGQTLDNTIPMCGECNNWASNDMVFDDTGRILALASTRLVDNSDLSVKLLIFNALKNDKDINPGRK